MAPSTKLAKRFNPNKDYGTVHGDPRFAFQQNGVFYNGGYQAVDDDGKPIPMEAGAPVPDTLDSVPPLKKPTRQIDPEDETEDEKPLDLRAWRAGKLPGTLWHQVIAAVKAQLGKTPSSKVDAAAMIDAKWPPPDPEPENETAEA